MFNILRSLAGPVLNSLAGRYIGVYGGCTPPPLPYPPLYIGFLACLPGGTIPREKFFRKKSGKGTFAPISKIKIFQKKSENWEHYPILEKKILGKFLECLQLIW